MSKPLAFLCLLIASSCAGPEVASDFTNFSEEAFLAACTQTTDDIAIDDEEAVVDSQITTDLCRCVFDKLSQELTFEEFEEIDTLLTDEPNTPLPAELRDSLSDCLILELNL